MSKLVRMRDVQDAIDNLEWYSNGGKVYVRQTELVNAVDSIPAVDAVEEKQGFWKVAGTGHPKPGNQRYRKQDQWTVYKCSNCGASNGRNHSDPYCRHCGARMLVDNCRYCYNDERREEEHNAQID